MKDDRMAYLQVVCKPNYLSARWAALGRIYYIYIVTLLSMKINSVLLFLRCVCLLLLHIRLLITDTLLILLTVARIIQLPLAACFLMTIDSTCLQRRLSVVSSYCDTTYTGTRG
jgi:hypothetical protein